MATISNAVKSVTAKSIDSSINKLKASLVKNETSVLSIAQDIINFGDAGNGKGFHDYQGFNALMAVLINYPRLEKAVVEFCRGKMPHAFMRKDGALKIGKKDASLVMDDEQLKKALAAKEAAKAASKEKADKNRADKKEAADKQLAELERLRAEKQEPASDRLKKSNETLKANNKTLKSEADKAASIAQALKVKLEKAELEATKLAAEVESLKVQYEAIQAAYSRLKIENNELHGAINAHIVLATKQGEAAKQSEAA
jgi:hypothetical protein